jgi:hypothetical protein
MEGTHIDLGAWWQAFGLVVGGATARQIENDVGVSYKTARRMRKLIDQALAARELLYAAKRFHLKPRK